MVSSKAAKARITANAKLYKQKSKGVRHGREQIYGLFKVQNGNSKRHGI